MGGGLMCGCQFGSRLRILQDFLLLFAVNTLILQQKQEFSRFDKFKVGCNKIIIIIYQRVQVEYVSGYNWFYWVDHISTTADFVV